MKRLVCSWLVSGALSLGLGSVTVAAPVAVGASETDVVYGEAGGTQLKLDVYRPAGTVVGKHVGIVLIHGGGWSSYDKSTMDAMGCWLVRNGYVAFSIDYRLLNGTKNQWPAQLDDAQLAVRWVRANAKTYDIDPGKIGAFGHSAGAQMVSLLGEEDTRDKTAALAEYSSKVQAVVDVSGPSDFPSWAGSDGESLLSRLLGGTKKEKPEAWKSASPALNVTKDTAPFLILHGTKDEDVPIAQAEEFAAALMKVGVDATLETVDDGHAFTSEAARRLLAFATVAFFDRTLR